MESSISSNSRRRADDLLHEYWGFQEFRDGQWEAIEALLNERDVLTIMPTGGGKSLCYQLSALLVDGCVLVISPLVSLMQDQVASLKARGIEASFINSTVSKRVIDQRLTDAEYGRYRLLYITPEGLSSELFEARADRLNISLIAVDEAHCVSEWGHDFRPAYLEIADVRTDLGNPPMIAVTATATPEVRQGVSSKLKLQEPQIIVKGFDRPNILWSVFHDRDKRAKVDEIIRKVEGTGLIYAATRRQVETWANWLDTRGVSAAGYHGGMDGDERTSAQRRWIDNDVRIMVATNAFGMGIDKPDVRFVIHVALPGSVEAYYQEAGRAGRDGASAHAVLFVEEGDEQLREHLIAASHPSREQVHEVYDAVCSLGQVPMGSQPDEPVPVDLPAIRKVTDLSRTTVRAALDLLERQGVWTTVPLRGRYGLIRFQDSIEAIRSYADRLSNRALADFVRTVLRTVYADAASRWFTMDIRRLEGRTDLSRERLMRGLKYLEERGLIAWYPPDSEALCVQFVQPRVRSVPLDMELMEIGHRQARRNLQRMLRYAWSPICRRRFLLSYFGEDHQSECTGCDRCLERHEMPTYETIKQPAERLLRQIEQEGEVDTWNQKTEQALRWLLKQGSVAPVNPVQGRYRVVREAVNEKL